MTSAREFTPEEQRAVEQIEKLLRLAAKNKNEHEAAAATAQAQRLLAAYNLDIATVEEATGKSTKRVDEKLAGGLYKFQRALWQAVAELNFCLYWNQYEYVSNKRTRTSPYTGEKYKVGGWIFRHRLVGRHVNVISTQNMAQYLEQTIERLTRERVGDGTQYFTKWAIAYREGMADRIQEKIYERRHALLAEEKQRKFEEEQRARAANSEGVSTGTALTIADVVKREYEANCDFLYGEGWSAKCTQQRVERAQAQAEAEAAYTQWAKNHPEEAAQQEEQRRKEARKRPWNYGMRTERWNGRDNSSAYYSGYEDGARVSIDPQVKDAVARRIADE